MNRQTRVYPAQRTGSGWISILLLATAGLIALSGVIWRDTGNKLAIEPLSSVTPIPLEESFDETPATRELALPSSEWHALQLGAFENEKAAAEMADQYGKRGAAGYVWHDGRYRVLAAVYPLKEDAQRVRDQLQELHEIETYLYQIRLPEIHLRLSGMQGQLDILEAAVVHANDLIAELQQVSIAMDRQEMNAAEALARLRTLNEQISLVHIRLRQRFASPRHGAVDALLTCFEHCSAFCAALNDHLSQVELSTRIKHQTLGSLEDLQNVYDTLSHT